MENGNRLPFRPVSAIAAAVWIAVISGSGVILSLYFACVTPFVGLATVAAIALPGRLAISAVVLAWLSNQAIGYSFLGYAHTWDSYAWGLVIGAASTASAFAVIAVLRYGSSFAARTMVAFPAAFVAYEGILFAATAFLPSGDGAFSVDVMVPVLAVNAVAALALGTVHIVGSVSQLMFERAALPTAR